MKTFTWFGHLALFLLGISFVKGQGLPETITVTAGDLGKIKGFKVISNRFKPYYNFAGVPYGVEPTGPLRFKVKHKWALCICICICICIFILLLLFHRKIRFCHYICH
jgi:hypothetical protein